MNDRLNHAEWKQPTTPVEVQNTDDTQQAKKGVPLIVCFLLFAICGFYGGYRATTVLEGITFTVIFLLEGGAFQIVSFCTLTYALKRTARLFSLFFFTAAAILLIGTFSRKRTPISA